MILDGVEPKKLNTSLKDEDISNIKKSALINAFGFLLNKLFGVDGPLNINK